MQTTFVLSLVLPPPDVSIEVTGSSESIAGTTYSLMCRATVPTPLARPPNVTWVGLNANDADISLTSNMVSGSESRLTLTFSPLRTSHGDVYTCQAGFNTPEFILPDLNNAASTTVRVTVQSECFKTLEEITPIANYHNASTYLLLLIIVS